MMTIEQEMEVYEKAVEALDLSPADKLVVRAAYCSCVHRINSRLMHIPAGDSDRAMRISDAVVQLLQISIDASKRAYLEKNPKPEPKE
jgi:hypothetical protein